MTRAIRSEDIDRLKFINPAGLYDPKPNAY